jgi:hypothetical protein
MTQKEGGHHQSAEAVMGSEDLSVLVDEIRQASGAIERGDSAVNKRVDKLENSVNELYRKTSRPGVDWVADDRHPPQRDTKPALRR